MSPLIRNITIGVGGTVAAVAIFFGAINAGNYQGAILHHLVDIVQGPNTSTVSSLNAPNWAGGIPLAQPTIATVASSTFSSAASGLASSTTWYFEVAALDNNGTTTVSSSASFTTDASTTQARPEVINVTWATVAGATGYALYFSTSTPNSFTQYFLATSTNGTPNTTYNFATSSGSLAGTNTLPDTTAFATLINPGGTSYLNGGPLQVNGGSTQTAGYFYGSVNNFLQQVLHNTNTGTNASADFVVCNNLSKVLWPLGANCPTYYADFGINSSAFSQAAFTGESANDAFFGSSDSNLDIETASTTGPANINFLTGGTLTQNLVMTIDSLAHVGIGTTSSLVANFQAAATSSNATSSVEFGKANQNKGACLTVYRTDGTPVYIFVAAGATALTITATQPSGCTK